MTTAFTLEDIAGAHAGVSRATVRDYLARLLALGVARYVTHVADGRSDYFDADGGLLSSGPVHDPYAVADTVDRRGVDRAVEAHGRGETDYFVFSRQLAAAGVETWVMDPLAMTCAYRSKVGEVLRADRL